ncbi:hypothetical protein [Comamonas fluminis]|uniref:hypothetical protein n=1 Tax=Comamonas fluminis TaxID=2796366 RepID=UPI001C43DF59|nr:hypothetical protein [Comamonas fluminis]
MRKLLLAVALGSALSAHAADSKFDAFMGTVVGNSTTVTFGGNGQPIATTSNHLGTPSANTVGNMGVATVNGDPHYVGRAEAPVAGTNKKVPIDVKVPINKRSVARALIAAAKYGVGGAGGIAVGYAAEALLDFGLKNVTVGADGSVQADSETQAHYPVSDGYYWKLNNGNQTNFLSAEDACIAGRYDNTITFVSVQMMDGGTWAYCNAKWPFGTVYQYQIFRQQQSNCPAGHYVDQGICTPSKPLTKMTEQEILDWIAARDGWPTSATRAIAQMSADPRVEPLIQTGTPNITGPFKIQETPTVRTFSEPKPGVAGQTQSVTETKQKTVGLDYADNKVKATTTETKQRVVDGVAEPEDTTQKDPENDFLVCGLPNTPACRIEEKGTPEPVEDTAQKDAERVHKPLDDLLKDPKSVLPSFPTINWTFRLPSGCAPLSIPAFSPFLQEIDVCQFQPIFHDIMSMIWVGGALFGAIGTFWRNVFAKAG